MNTPQNAYFFGYGSLVNCATHDFAETYIATARGWRREWRHTAERNVAFLTAVPDRSCVIEGLIAAVPNNDWSPLDVREAAYDRVEAGGDIEHPLVKQPQIVVFTIPPEKFAAPDAAQSILMSYLDVVIQGYFDHFGVAGAVRFFETTHGWDAPVLNDRAAPIYPRHVEVSAEVQSFVDAQLTALSTVVK